MLIGVVGKPSTGKSTFFKAATLAEVEIAPYPFTTIKPNHGVGYVKVDCVDKEFGRQCNPREGYCINGVRFVPAELLDVAGLVPGAHEGRGMGNQFLDDLNQADVLIHIVDISGSTNEKGESVKPLSYDPLKDVEFLEEELNYWYMRILKKGWEKFARVVQQENQDIKRALAKQLSGLRVTEEIVQNAIKKLDLIHRPLDWSEKDLFALSSELRKATKPIIIAANKIDVEGAMYNFDRMKEKYPDYVIIPCSAESELALREAAKKNLIKYIPGEKSFEIIGELNERQRQGLEFIKKHLPTGVQDVLDTAVFNILKYIAIFPGGVNKLTDSKGRVLPDCFLVSGNSTALDFAYRLHTDFGKNFIRAIDVKTKMTVGKEHKLKHRDVVEIVSGK